MRKHLNIIIIIILVSILLNACSIREQLESIQVSISRTPEVITPIRESVPRTNTPFPTGIPTNTQTPTAAPTATQQMLDVERREINVITVSNLSPIRTIGKGEVIQALADEEAEMIIALSTPGIYLYRSNTYEEVAFLKGYTQFFKIPGKTQIVAITPELAFDIISTKDGSIVSSIKSLNVKEIVTIAFSPDSSLLAAVITLPQLSWDGRQRQRIDIWELETSTLKTKLESNLLNDCLSIAISPDHTYLAARYDSTFAMWNINEKKILYNVPIVSFFTQNPFSNDSFYFATFTRNDNRGEVFIRRTSNGDIVARASGSISDNPFSADNKHFVTSSSGLLRIWYTPTSDIVEEIETGLDWPSVAYSSEGNHILVNRGQQAYKTSDFSLDANYPTPKEATPLPTDGMWNQLVHYNGIKGVHLLANNDLFIWGVSSGHIVWWLEVEKNIYTEVNLGEIKGQPAISSWRDMIAVCTVEGLKILYLQDSRVESLGNCRSENPSIAFSPDGTNIYITNQMIIDQIDIASNTVIRQWRGHTSNVGIIKIYQNGKYMVSTTAAPVKGGYELYLWSLSPVSRIQEWYVPDFKQLNSAIIPPDASAVITSFDKVRVWRTADRLELENFEGESIASSPSGDLVAVSRNEYIIFYSSANWRSLGYVSNESNFFKKGSPYIPYTQQNLTKVDQLPDIVRLEFIDGGQILTSLTKDGIITLWAVD